MLGRRLSWKECLMYKYKDLSSNARKSCKKPGALTQHRNRLSLLTRTGLALNTVRDRV